MDVRINTANCTFEAVEDGVVITAITWDWARQCGARFRAELADVAVCPVGTVHDEPPGGWVDRPIKTKVVDGAEVVVQTVRELPTECPAGWTLSQRWKMRAWSPLSARIVDVVVGDDVVPRVSGSESGPGALVVRDTPGTHRAVRFARADGGLIDDVIIPPSDDAVLDMVEL